MATDFLHGVETVVVDSGPRPIETVRSAIIGIVGTAPGADVVKFPINTPVLINSRGGFAGIGLTGSLPAALAGIFDQFSPYVVLIRVAEGASAIEAEANVVGGVNGSTGARTGIQAFRDSQTIVGVTPMILIAPGFTAARTGSTKNAVAAALEAIAGQLRAHAIVAGPSTTDAAAIAYRADFSSRRVFIVDPFVKILDTVGAAYVDEDPTARVAGLIARIDHEVGFWKSPSNETLAGVLGLARPIDYALGDATTRANLLNSNEVATIIRDDGFRLWGNRTTSEDAKWAFLCVSRTADMIDISIQQGHRWACDQVIDKGYVEAVVSGVNAYLRQLQTRGAILGGQCWFDRDFNADADIAAGHVTFSYDFTAPSPAERITFRSTITDAYIASIFAAD